MNNESVLVYFYDWMDTKKKQFPNHLQSYTPYGVVYKIR